VAGMRTVDGGGSGGATQDQYECIFGINPDQTYDIEARFITRTNGQNHVFDKNTRPELGNVTPAQIGHFMEIRDSVSTITAISTPEIPLVISDYQLHQNYPNPFNSTTIIPFKLDKSYNVIVAVYDMTGQEVICLVNEKLNRGNYEVQWNGKNKMGESVASGVYFYCLILNDSKSAMKKTILLK
jgi:hypothetical protein